MLGQRMLMAAAGAAGENPLWNGCILYNKFDTNGDLEDATGNQSDWTNNGATFTSDGKINGAYDYDGTTSSMGMSDFVIPTAEFTIAAWVKFTDSSAAQMISGADSTIRTYQFRLEDNTGYAQWIPFVGATPYVITGTTNCFGLYHLIVATFSDSSNIARLYVDASDEGSLSITAGAMNAQTGIGLGRLAFDQGSNLANGPIDEFAVWNRVLSPSEITELYNLGAGKQYPN